MNISPSNGAFNELAKKFNIIPVMANVTADLETPISVYYKVVGDKTGFILESADSSSNFGRYSFIGTDPFAIFTAYPRQAKVMGDDSDVTIKDSPLTALKKYLAAFSVPPLPDLTPFAGGAVGYFNYETVGTWERNRMTQLPPDMLLAELMLCKTIIVFDHLRSSTTIIRLVKIEADQQLDVLYSEAADKIREIALKLDQPLTSKQTDLSQAKETVLPTNNDEGKENYVNIVTKAKEYIAAGDIFQVVLSAKFTRKLNLSPIAVYRRLRQLNPSPYMFYLNFGKRQVIGASPEMLVKVTDGKVETCPIAGTRPRGKNEEQDANLAADLIADSKEVAEHAMLVDLGRNDIGRVSRPGTVKVEQLMEVEKFSHVMHMVSKVSGQLRSDYSALDALAACFPAGTVSGAPKIRAMEIISQLEQRFRGPYAGAVGYVDFNGNMDTCITIRTMVAENGEAVIQTGAGIVADSVPEKEYQEIRQKAQAIFSVLDGGGDK